MFASLGPKQSFERTRNSRPRYAACSLSAPRGPAVARRSTPTFDRVRGKLEFTRRERLLAERCGRIDSVRIEVPGSAWP